MPGRRSPPLFELLERQQARTERRRPARVEAPPPPPEPRREPEEHEEEIGTIRRIGAAMIANGAVSLPLSYVYIALALIIMLGVMTWTVAYNAGVGAEKTRMVQDLSSPRPSVSDPLAVDRPLAETVQPRRAPSTQREPARTQPPPPEPASGAPGILTAAGPTPDPREPGLNYLHLVSGLSEQEAQRAVKFLSDNGLETLAAPLDPARASGNNPVRYELVLAKGFPGSEFSASKPERDRMVRDAKRLGERWQREMKGSTRFPSPQWTKHRP